MMSLVNSGLVRAAIQSFIESSKTFSPKAIKNSLINDPLLFSSTSVDDVAEMAETMYHAGEMPQYKRIKVVPSTGFSPRPETNISGYIYTRSIHVPETTTITGGDALTDAIPEVVPVVPDLGNLFTPYDVQSVKETDIMFRVPGSDIPAPRVIEEAQELAKDTPEAWAVQYAARMRAAMEAAENAADAAANAAEEEHRADTSASNSVPSYATSSGAVTVIGITPEGLADTYHQPGRVDPLTEMVYFFDGYGRVCIPPRELKKIGAMPGDQLHLLAERKRVTICKNNPVVGGRNNTVEESGIVRINRMILSEAGLGSESVLSIQHEDDALYLRPSVGGK